MSALRLVLIDRLRKLGMEDNLIGCYIRSMKKCFADNPELGRPQLQQRLTEHGWRGIDLDEDTVHIAAVCYTTGRL